MIGFFLKILLAFSFLIGSGQLLLGFRKFFLYERKFVLDGVVDFLGGFVSRREDLQREAVAR
jgi:hypothetical protein